MTALEHPLFLVLLSVGLSAIGASVANCVWFGVAILVVASLIVVGVQIHAGRKRRQRSWRPL